MSTLNGWHLGECIMHQHYSDFSIMNQYQYINCDLPADHAKFHLTRLPFVPVITLDSAGRPWGLILAGNDGKPGFIKNLRYSVLSVEANVWPGDPLLETAKAFGNGDSEMLVAGIGIKFLMRRRNKFAGNVMSLQRNGETFSLDLTVNEAIWFIIFPFLVVDATFFIFQKIYHINQGLGEFVPHPTTWLKVTHQQLYLSPEDRLPSSLISFIHDADSVLRHNICCPIIRGFQVSFAPWVEPAQRQTRLFTCRTLRWVYSCAP
jgi:hypothetical protein